ncbi:MAG: ATP-binding protein [bacterium]|nr:ATP-binding protein [bacterium]
MRLLDARIKNFKGIENWQIEFKPGFNLIKGTNGKGKTSILEAVAVGLGSFLSGVPDIKARHITKDEMRRVFYIIGDGSYGCRYEIPVEIEFNAILNDEPIHWQRSKNSIQATKSTTQPSDIKRLAEKMSNTQDIELPLLNYQGAARIWSQKKEKADNFFRGHYFRTVGYTDTLDEASNIKLLLNWCLKMEQIAWQKNRPISEYETVKRTVSKFMSLLEPDKEYTFFYDRQQDSLLCQENNKVLKIADMSAGYQSLIWMVLDIAFRMAVLNPFKLYAIPETCDQHRGHTPLYVDPRSKRHIGLIKYDTKNGNIYSDDEKINADLNNTLNLNCGAPHYLPNNRKAVLDAVINKLSKDKLWKKSDLNRIKRLWETREATGELKAYAGIVLWYVTSRLKQTRT